MQKIVWTSQMSKNNSPAPETTETTETTEWDVCVSSAATGASPTWGQQGHMGLDGRPGGGSMLQRGGFSTL